MILEKSGLVRAVLICNLDKRWSVFFFEGHAILHFHIQFHFNIKRGDEVREHREESWLIENNDRFFYSQEAILLSAPHPPRTETKTESSRAKCLF